MIFQQNQKRPHTRTREEAQEALQQLTPTQKRRLLASAHHHFVPALSRIGWQPEDLLQEAMCRTLSGKRRWRVGVTLIRHLRMCMKSTASNLCKPEKRHPLLACELETLESHSGQPLTLEEAAWVEDRTEPSWAQQQLLDLQDRLRQQGARRTLAVLRLLIRDASSQVIQRRLKLSPSAYAYQIRRLRQHARHTAAENGSFKSEKKTAPKSCSRGDQRAS